MFVVRVPIIAMLLVAAGCGSRVGSRGPRDDGAPVVTRLIPLGAGIALPAGEIIAALPKDARYRFVAPDSLVRGATRDDLADGATARALRASIGTVLQSQGWRESPDSSGYDLSAFVATRTVTRTEERHESIAPPPTGGLPRCDPSRGTNQPRCTSEPERPRTRTVRVSVPVPVMRVVVIMRRRSDGAVRYWIQEDQSRPSLEPLVARDLVRLFARRVD
ncbi:MAG: hypothetical protein IPJ78_17550 [Gemmatimonadetes bacterium]|nr:hypothetical protein [Gemmatimonadota bacterium]